MMRALGVIQTKVLFVLCVTCGFFHCPFAPGKGQPDKLAFIWGEMHECFAQKGQASGHDGKHPQRKPGHAGWTTRSLTQAGTALSQYQCARAGHQAQPESLPFDEKLTYDVTCPVAHVCISVLQVRGNILSIATISNGALGTNMCAVHTHGARMRVDF